MRRVAFFVIYKTREIIVPMKCGGRGATVVKEEYNIKFIYSLIIFNVPSEIVSPNNELQNFD